MPEFRESALLEFRTSTRKWCALWDPRRKTMLFEVKNSAHAPHLISLGLDSFEHYSKDVAALSPRGNAEFKRILKEWPPKASDIEESEAIAPFESLAFYALQSSIGTDRGTAPNPEGIIRWLLLQGSWEPWIHGFHDELSYRSRYRLMKAALSELSKAREGEKSHLASVDSSDRATREKFWFTLRRQCDLAEQWYREAGDFEPEAEAALRRSRISYLQVLKEEPYRTELDRFLYQVREKSQNRTGSESEIARLLDIDGKESRNGAAAAESPGGNNGGLMDPAIDKKFFSWFLERYDLRSARILMWRTLPDRERWGAFVSLAGVILAVILFALQVIDRHRILASLPPIALSPDRLWMCQLGAQGVALLSAAWMSPSFFNIVLPRALFGSLLTWITLIFTSIPGLWAIEIDEHKHTLRNLVHQALQDHPWHHLYFVIPSILLAMVFVMREIGHWTSSRRIILDRACRTTIALYAGALFWGIMFALPIRHLLEFRPESPCPNCLLPIAMIGASLAAIFGIVVELLWEDRSIAEPLEEPI